MLRITRHDTADGLTLQLEGRLGGAWVAELEDSWRSAVANLGGRTLRVDLSGVVWVDAAGKYLLALMHKAGANFIAPGCMLAALVQDVTGNWPDVSEAKPRRH
jgi:anti-anti-sigma regulatory factor